MLAELNLFWFKISASGSLKSPRPAIKLLNSRSHCPCCWDFVVLAVRRQGFPELHEQIFEIAVGETDATNAT